LNNPVREEDLLSDSFKRNEETIERHKQFYSDPNKENKNDIDNSPLYNIANSGQDISKKTRDDQKYEVPLMTPAGNFIILIFTKYIEDFKTYLEDFNFCCV
jgi:hypothetical protein